MPFRDAYTVTGKLVAFCAGEGKTLEELSLEELRTFSALFDEDVYDALKLENCMSLRNSYGGPAVAETSRQIEEMKQFIAARRTDGEPVTARRTDGANITARRTDGKNAEAGE